MLGPHIFQTNHSSNSRLNYPFAFYHGMEYEVQSEEGVLTYHILVWEATALILVADIS